MAIQVRRGNYADLDTSKLVQGEPFVTLDEVGSDYYVGMTIAPNNVVRLATWDNLTDIETTCEQYRDEAEASKIAAALSESHAADSEEDAEAWAVGQRNGTDVPSTDPTYQNNSKYYSEQSGTYWGYVHDAVDLVEPVATINFATGQLEITGTSLWFGINQLTGNLEFAFSHG